MENTVSAFTVTANTFAPVTNAINSALNTLIPIGIGIMGTFIIISYQNIIGNYNLSCLLLFVF